MCDGSSHLCFQYPARLYDFDWSIGKEWQYDDFAGAACTCFPVNLYTSGKIQEIKHATFGAQVPMDYVDIDSVATYYGGRLKGTRQVDGKLIKGIGVSSWDAGCCLFGPAFGDMPDTHRSILVHFERDGKVLYDLWPNVKNELESRIDGVAGVGRNDHSIYDLQGRRLPDVPSHGLYIMDGKKRLGK